MLTTVLDKWKNKIHNETISENVTRITEFLKVRHIENKECTRIAFTIEEALCFYKEQLGNGCEFEILLKKGFKSIIVELRVYGSSLNPLLKNDDEYFFHIASFLQGTTENSVIYDYKNGCNIIACTTSRKLRKNIVSGNTLVISVIMGLMVGFLCNQLPEDTQVQLVQSVTDPCLKVILGMLSGIMGPVVFLLVISSFISMDSIATFNQMGIKILKKISKINLVEIGVTFLVCLAAYNGNIEFFTGFKTTDFVQLLLGVIPTNIFSPFVTNNILQIVIIASFVGIVMLMLGLCNGIISEFITEVSRVIMHMMRIITRLTPILIFLSIVNTSMKLNMANSIYAVKFILLYYASIAAYSLIVLLSYKLKTGKPIMDAVTNGKAYFTKSFICGSAVAAMPELIAATNSQKINQIFSKLYISTSTVLDACGNLIFLICSAFFVAEITGEAISIAWIIGLAILSLELSIATPKGAGGILVTVTVLLEQLGTATDNTGLVAIAFLLCSNSMALITAISRYFGLMELSDKCSEQLTR